MALVLAIITAVGIMVAVFATVRSRGYLTRRRAEARLQALWLARSALGARVSGVRTVETPHGRAQVRVAGGTAQVELEQVGRATVSAAGESFEYFAAP